MNHYIAPTLRLERIEVRLWNAPTYVPFAGPAWWDFAPNRLGIYALWNRSENPIYVGESSNLQERIRYNLGSPKSYVSYPDSKSQQSITNCGTNSLIYSHPLRNLVHRFVVRARGSRRIFGNTLADVHSKSIQFAHSTKVAM